MFGFIGPIGPWELGLILVIVLLIFGPGKLPEVGKYVGKGMKEFKSAVNNTASEAEAEDDTTPEIEQSQSQSINNENVEENTEQKTK